MMRTVGLLVVAQLLAACSGSTRLGGVHSSGSADSGPYAVQSVGASQTAQSVLPPPTARTVTPSSTGQAMPDKRRLEPAAKPDARPQEAKQPAPPSLPEE